VVWQGLVAVELRLVKAGSGPLLSLSHHHHHLSLSLSHRDISSRVGGTAP
jgi:hypothetical protein